MKFPLITTMGTDIPENNISLIIVGKMYQSDCLYTYNKDKLISNFGSFT